MAEDEEAAAAAGRLEAALARIEQASHRTRATVPGDGRLELVAQRLDALITQLRTALEQDSEEQP